MQPPDRIVRETVTDDTKLRCYLPLGLMRDSLVLYRTLLSDNFMWFTYIKIRPRVTSHELEISSVGGGCKRN